MTAACRSRTCTAQICILIRLEKNMSTSNVKREKQKEAKLKRAKSRKRSGLWSKIKLVLKFAVPIVLIAGLVIWIIVDAVSSGKSTENDADAEIETVDSTEAADNSTEAEGTELGVDYSACLTDDGMIKDINISDYVKLPDLSSVSVDLSDVEPSDEEMETALADYMETVLDTDTDNLIQDGDSVNIDYTGYVDGETFEGGHMDGAGTELTIGSGKYIDDFEQQLIGHAPGENVTVEVTFPEDYGNEELNGKDAVFEVTINGIYKSQLPSDEYVAENYSEYGSTYAELEASIKENLQKEKVQDCVWNYISENSEVSSYPEDYLNNLLEVMRYQYESEYNYYNEYYYSLAGEYQWESVYDYYDVDEEEYEKSISDGAYSEALYYMLAQALYEKFDLSISDEDVTACIAMRGYTEDDLSGLISTYGSGYIYQSTMGDVVSNYIIGLAEIKED